MKQLICEMCGGPHLIKQDGMYVCQSCGTKYTVEEARKMMIEGTVKVDNTDRLQNLYTLARRAKDAGNAHDAADYYGQIIIEDPESWEANFYKTYYSCMNTTIANMRESCITLANSIESTFRLIKKTISDLNKQKDAFKEVIHKCEYYGGLIANNINEQSKGYSDPSYALEYMGKHYAGVAILWIKTAEAALSVGLQEDGIEIYKKCRMVF